MVFYNLFDEEKVFDSTKLSKYIVFVISLICLSFLIIYLFTLNLIYIVLFFALVLGDVLMLFRWFLYKQMYARKITIETDSLKLFSTNNKAIRQYNISDIKAEKREMVFNNGPYSDYSKYAKTAKCVCLVLYKDIELYENMEYISYWNDENMLIIQNPELISKLEYLIDRPTS